MLFALNLPYFDDSSSASSSKVLSGGTELGHPDRPIVGREFLGHIDISKQILTLFVRKEMHLVDPVLFFVDGFFDRGDLVPLENVIEGVVGDEVVRPAVFLH